MACRSRTSAVINGTSPGPPLRITPDQTTWVRVYNDMENENLTMHWHGLSQSIAPFSDGTPLVSQWPIPPQHFFDYELHPNKTESGTYFYHSHVGFQTVSAIGPLIIEDVDGCPYEYDEERIIQITEYFNKSDDAIVEGLLVSPFVWSGEAMAILVNGNSAEAKSEATEDDAGLEGQCGPELIRVEPGKTYRFRNIAAAALSAMTYGIEDHDNLTIIEADGRYTKPATTDHLELGSGMRFDYLLTTKTESELTTLNKHNFWIQIEIRDRPVNYTSYACLSYDGQGCGAVPSQNSPIITLPHGTSWLEYTLEPLSPNNFPTLSDVTRQVTIVTEQVNISGALVWHFNGQRLDVDHPRPTPYLVDIYRQGAAAIPSPALTATNNSFSSAFNAYAASLGDVIDIVWLQRPNIPAGGFDSHPLHAHGGHFYDLGSGPGSYDAEANERRFQHYTPVLRDTTFLYRYTTDADTAEGVDQGWRAWRVRVEDPGVWLLHCHTLQHMIMGMQTVWVMGDAEEITRGDGLELQGYLDYGGSAYGSDGDGGGGGGSGGGEGSSGKKAPVVKHHWDGVGKSQNEHGKVKL
ncbi:L-ascorbate oxidase [Cyphellophora europaea CBS 101466]|uniref:L-ascorbate oxidase n=1 Tax=Cyphellophora europaea (strain CBS 101466) TaxID=1220924 RepID=W2RJN2_CYPE1|nr:L-ascorbate oxidase [Cyphellophora europaea CBS 101466]ETN36555.1 L-ascorbate oxidase [Cyphellophora europaea CBS 101466]